jgi:hypothetical protein
MSVDLETMKTRTEKDPMAAEWLRDIETKDKAAREAFERSAAPRGTLGLPRKLDDARFTHRIPNGAFQAQPVFDRVWVWQIPDFDGDTFASDSIIHITDWTKQHDRFVTPRGILVGAGLKALDNLWGHGIELGDAVDFIEISPYRRSVGFVGGKQQWVMAMRDGDIVAGVDLRGRMLSGELEVMMEDGLHHLVGRDGVPRTASMPWIPEDK